MMSLSQDGHSPPWESDFFCTTLPITPLYKASRGAAAKIPPPPGVIVSFGLSGSPSCTIGLLSDKCAILSDESDAAEYRPAAPSQLPRPALPPGSPAHLSRPSLPPISPSAAPLPAPGTDGCPIDGVKRSRRPTGPIGPTSLIRQRARPIG